MGGSIGSPFLNFVFVPIIADPSDDTHWNEVHDPGRLHLKPNKVTVVSESM